MAARVCVADQSPQKETTMHYTPPNLRTLQDAFVKMMTVEKEKMAQKELKTEKGWYTRADMASVLGWPESLVLKLFICPHSMCRIYSLVAIFHLTPVKFLWSKPRGWGPRSRIEGAVRKCRRDPSTLIRQSRPVFELWSSPTFLSTRLTVYINLCYSHSSLENPLAPGGTSMMASRSTGSM